MGGARARDKNGSRSLRNFQRDRFEKLNRIAVGIFQLDLLAPWTYFHVIAETQTCLSQFLNLFREPLYVKDRTVPSAGFLGTTIRHGAGTGSTGPAENEF